MKTQLATPAASLPSSQDDALTGWETTTRKAVALMRDASDGAALSACESALAIARRLVAAPAHGRAEDCIAALVVSHHNLADVKTACGDADAAIRHLCQAHETLAALAGDGNRPAAVRQAALRHMRETHRALVAHVAEHGAHTSITHALCTGVLASDAGRPAWH